MPRCIECMSSVARVVHPETNTVERCAVCGESVDTYFEFGDTQKWIDIALLQKRTWVHAICNKTDATLRYVLFAVLCCGLEAFVARSFFVLWASGWASSDPDSSQDAKPDSRTLSLQVVKTLQDPTRLAMMQYGSTLPRLTFYATVEFFLLVAVAVSLGGKLCPKDEDYEEVLGQWVRAVSLASSVRVVYVVFLIWHVPMSLLPVVDFLFFVWLARGVFVLTMDHSWVYSVPAILLCAGARFFFRQLTEWNSVMWM